MNKLDELYRDPWTAWSSACLVGLLGVASVQYYRNRYNYWAARGVPGVRPLPLIGDLLLAKVPEEQLARRLGSRVFGAFYCGEPSLIIADAEVANQVCARDFRVFINHEWYDWLNEFQEHLIIRLKDDHWRTVRQLMTPTFTTGKLRRMYTILDENTDEMIERLRKSADTSKIQLDRLIVPLALNGIVLSCFSTKLPLVSKPNEGGVREMASMVLNSIRPGKMELALLSLLPAWLRRLIGFKAHAVKNFTPLASWLRAQLKRRRDAGEENKYNDLLQMLADAQTKRIQHVEATDLMHSEYQHAALAKEDLEHELRLQRLAGQAARASGSLNAKGELAELDIIGAAYFSLAAGFATTLPTMVSLIYSLAHHAREQELLYMELKQIAHLDEASGHYQFKYDQLSALVYLDAVVSESMRLFPPVVKTGRVASEDYVIEKYNIHLKRDSHVQVAIHALHMDPEYWQDPHTFRPDRFLPDKRGEVVPGSYMPFGIGPRHCVGMRFALMEIKIGIAKLLMDYRVLPVANTSWPPETNVSNYFKDPQGARVNLSPRKPVGAA